MLWGFSTGHSAFWQLHSQSRTYSWASNGHPMMLNSISADVNVCPHLLKLIIYCIFFGTASEYWSQRPHLNGLIRSIIVNYSRIVLSSGETTSDRVLWLKSNLPSQWSSGFVWKWGTHNSHPSKPWMFIDFSLPHTSNDHHGGFPKPWSWPGDLG